MNSSALRKLQLVQSVSSATQVPAAYSTCPVQIKFKALHGLAPWYLKDHLKCRDLGDLLLYHQHSLLKRKHLGNKYSSASLSLKLTFRNPQCSSPIHTEPKTKLLCSSCVSHMMH